MESNLTIYYQSGKYVLCQVHSQFKYIKSNHQIKINLRVKDAYLRYNYLKIWNLRVQKKKVISQIKSLAMHITNERFVLNALLAYRCNDVVESR